MVKIANYPSYLPAALDVGGFTMGQATRVLEELRSLEDHTGTHSVALGQLDLLFALVTIVGLRWPAAWALPILTKVTPGVGLIWFLVHNFSLCRRCFTYDVGNATEDGGLSMY